MWMSKILEDIQFESLKGKFNITNIEIGDREVVSVIALVDHVQVFLIQR